jgi:hypothetical protein
LHGLNFPTIEFEISIMTLHLPFCLRVLYQSTVATCPLHSNVTRNH